MQIGPVSFGFEVEQKGDSPSLIHQVHGAEIVTLEGPTRNADGIMTRETGKTIYVFTADCLPVLFFGEAEDPIAAIHSGWRGALQGIVANAVQQLQIPNGRLHAILGPSIGPCCMEVKEDFIEKFREAGKPIERFLKESRGRKMFNLPELVIQTQLNTLNPAHIHSEHHRCTFCSTPSLPSFRRNGNTQIRLKNWICKSP